MEEVLPTAIGVCAFKDGTYEVYRDSVRVPPATTYIREDVIDYMADLMNHCLKYEPISEETKKLITGTLKHYRSSQS
jgi:hypothetical protein